MIDDLGCDNHAAGEYRIRRAECEAAAHHLGIGSLRDLDVSDLARIARLPDPLARRVRHVVAENARVLDAVEAIACRDLEWLGELFCASHASLRDDYEVSLPAIDTLVALALTHAEIFGARFPR